MSRFQFGLLIVALALFAASPASAVQPFDSTWYGYNTAIGSDHYFLSSAKMADVDNDGDLDVVASKFLAGFGTSATGFVVMKNDGNGRFTYTPQHYTSPLASQYLEVSDLNNDTFPDVVVSNSGNNYQGTSISVYLNNGNGSFGSATTYPAGTGPAGIAIADFNGDQLADVAVANYGSFGSQNTIAVFLNVGAGTFAPGISYAAGASPHRLAAARINADTTIDLVVANENGLVNVLLNNGSADFSARTEYSISQLGSGLFPSLSLTDVDNDSDTDILYTNLNLGSVKLLRNTGSSFSAAENIPMDVFGGGSMDIATGDLNMDGWSDIVATSTNARTTDGFQVALNNGSGGFLTARLQPAGQNTTDIMLGDVDGDGILDILTADSYGMQITVHKNFGGATFPLPRLFDTNSSIAGSIDAADIDGDGDRDVVTSASGRAAVGVPVKVMKNLGNGNFGPPISYSIRGGGVQAKFRDLNGDGGPDILFATAINSPPYDFHFALNNGDGTFGAVQTKSIGSCGWYDIDACDLDNDGDNDVVVTEWLGCPDVPLSGRRIFVCLNTGNAVFADPLIKLVGPQPGPIAWGDFNEDGNLDLATGASGAVIELSRGTGTGDLLAPLSFSIGDQGGATDLEVGDFNRDGHLDIASSDFWETTSMSVLYGGGDGTFGPALILPSAYSPDLLNVSGITSGDVDGDGDTDILVGNNASNCFSLYCNSGTTFIPAMRIGGYSSASAPLLRDFDGDGKGDIVALGSIPPSGIGSTLMFIRGHSIATGVSQSGAGVPAGFTLAQNYPNPFNPATTVSYTLPFSSRVTLKVFDALGRAVATLVDEEQSAGVKSARWVANGNASGVYFYRLEAGGSVQSRKMLLLR